MQYISRKPGLCLLLYATCVRVTPTLGYNALIAAHCNFLHGVFLRSTLIALCGRGDRLHDDATAVYPGAIWLTFVTLVRGRRASEAKLTTSGNAIRLWGIFIIWVQRRVNNDFHQTEWKCGQPNRKCLYLGSYKRQRRKFNAKQMCFDHWKLYYSICNRLR